VQSIHTIAVRAGRHIDTMSGAINSPLHMSVTYQRESDGTYPRGYFYSSYGNPNRAALEDCIAQLEGGQAAIAFSTGCAAIAGVFKTLSPGDHVLVPADVFQGTIRLLRDYFVKWGLSYNQVDMTNIDAVHAAIKPATKLFWTETLSNPLLGVTDIAAISHLAHLHKAICVVDNTMATPASQRALEIGADLVVHAATKYLNGHGDAMGGIIVARKDDERMEEIRRIRSLEGSVPSPFDCWMSLRGLKTLPLRMQAHAASALAIARHLAQHPAVETVNYPGLPSHPQHELAKRTLLGFGGIVSFQVRGGKDHAVLVASRLKLFINATSFGSTESLVQHQASSPTHGAGTGLADNLLRLSVGLESIDDLIADLDQALALE
jgi:cystathionine gamma-synthase